MKKILLVSSVLLFVLSLSFTICSAFAQTEIGVKVGDTFKYSVSGFSELYSWGMTPSEGVSVEGIDLYVKGISANSITFWGQFSFQNGTKTNDALISSEVLSEISLFITEANLTEQDFFDLVNTQSDIYDVELTDMVVRNYFGLDREVNRVIWRVKSGDSEGYGIYAYWDKKTGILTEMTVFDDQGEEEQVEVLNIELEETNLSAIPEFFGWSILPLFIIFTFITVFYRKKFKG
jgi:hypothetical protein